MVQVGLLSHHVHAVPFLDGEGMELTEWMLPVCLLHLLFSLCSSDIMTWGGQQLACGMWYTIILAWIKLSGEDQY